MKRELTLIIPFLNEKDEVANTLHSILTHSQGEVEIILINDCSDDGVDYKAIVQTFKNKQITYVQNTERKGVAACRNMGVKMCKTPYFLLLDCHMRFETTTWIAEICSELAKEEKLLLCCQTRFLYKTGGKVTASSTKTFGAHIDFDVDYMGVAWRYSSAGDVTLLPIPCVLGACYAMHKTYWEYLRGLEGLQKYGSDEQYISLKVWMSGGQCLLLPKTIIGHIYRHEPPYQTPIWFLVYNNMLICETLLPSDMKNKMLQRYRADAPKVFAEAYNCLLENADKVQELKAYYRSICETDFKKIVEMNKFSEKDRQSKAFQEKAWRIKDEFASVIARANEIPQGNCIVNGRMCLVLIYALYGKLMDNEDCLKIADKMVDSVMDAFNLYTPTTFKNGMLGFGWGVEFLIQNKLLEGDSNDVLETLDKRVMQINVAKLDDYSWQTGLRGILYYVVARLAGNTSKKPIFEETFLECLKQAAMQMVAKDTEQQDIKVALDFIDYMNDKTTPLHLAKFREIVPLVQENYPLEIMVLMGKLLDNLIELSKIEDKKEQ